MNAVETNVNHEVRNTNVEVYLPNCEAMVIAHLGCHGVPTEIIEVTETETLERLTDVEVSIPFSWIPESNYLAIDDGEFKKFKLSDYESAENAKIEFIIPAGEEGKFEAATVVYTVGQYTFCLVFYRETDWHKFDF